MGAVPMVAKNTTCTGRMPARAGSRMALNQRLVHGSIGMKYNRMNNVSHDRVIESTGSVHAGRGKSLCRAVVDSEQMVGAFSYIYGI